MGRRGYPHEAVGAADRIRVGWSIPTPVVAIYASTNYPDIADRGLQPASLCGTATLSLAVAKPRPHENR